MENISKKSKLIENTFRSLKFYKFFGNGTDTWKRVKRMPLIVTKTRPKLKYNLIQTKVKNDEFGLYKIESKEKPSNKVLIFFHGGAFVLPLSYMHLRMMHSVSRDSHAIVYLVIYPLFPKYNGDDIRNRAVNVYEKITKLEKNKKFYIGGDSAGGYITFYLTNYIIKNNLIKPSGILLLSPLLDFDPPKSDYEHLENGKDPLLASAPMKAILDKLLASKKIDDETINPMLMDYTYFPKTLLITSTLDMLHMQSRRFYEKYKNLNKIAYIKKDGLIHDFPLFKTKEGTEAHKIMANFLNED